MNGGAVRAKRAFFDDDGGFSTAGMALALLLTLALVFGSVQVYRVQSACADVQNVADACALAAENQVASYYLVAQACDAIVLSLSITGVLCTAAGVVALCIPAAQPAGEKLLEAAGRVMDTRSRFAKSAADGLNRLQRLLPFLAAAQAVRVAAANSTGASSFLGVAVLVPVEGEQVGKVDADAADDFTEKAQQDSAQIEQAAQQAEEMAQEADRHKRAAFMADCGAHPGFCMSERAASLAGMAGSSNPLYSSVDTWSFSVAMNRAKAYYPQRLAQEAPANSSVEELASSQLRRHFYAYAVDLISQGYVHDAPGNFDAHFPLLPKNTSEMKETPLYTQIAYPVTEDAEGQRVMHAWDGCPMVAELGTIGWGSIQQHEAEAMPTCPHCEFSASRVGKIAAATTSTSTGFEHYYRIVAENAAAYQHARNQADKAAEKVRGPVEDLLSRISDALSEAANNRITVRPPGSTGAIALVVDSSGVPVSSLVPASFVSNSGTLGTRAAIAGATLAPDEPDESANAISALFDGFQASMPVLGSLPQAVAHVWGSALESYGNAQHAVEGAVEQALNGLPLIGASGLGTWAADKLRSAIQAAGLEPMELAAWKPVLVNTYHVASADDGAFSRGLVAAKDAYGKARGQATGNPLAVLVGVAGGRAVGEVEDLEEGFVVAQIKFLGEAGPAIDVRIALPQSASDGAQGAIDSAVEAIQGALNEGEAVRPWR